MGWTGHGLYDGDNTQTQHITFCQWAKLPLSEAEISDFLQYRKTKIPIQFIPLFKKNLPLIIKKMNKNKFWDSEKALEWQMLMCLLLDNNMVLPPVIKKNGILATEYLMEQHAYYFNNPPNRRAALRRLLKKIK
jgi:hypothetical protein